MTKPAPRYTGSLTDLHGEVIDVRPCTLPCCANADVEEWSQPHASLTVRPDLGGPDLVRLDRVRFTSFTGRP